MTFVEVALFLGTTLSPLHARHGGEKQPPAALLDSQLTDGGSDCWLPGAGLGLLPADTLLGGPGFHCNVYPSPRVLVLGGGGQFLI